ncbi:NgoFVII family restriction endonuclease [Providencia stuartii]|nr:MULTISPECIES: phospholipase D family protein [Providencia]MTC82203.1 NgoFVII family restriction endonuclease [Providencia stuartii]MTC93249.1 NgoFVII family restriction endonuclease [Providencia stuartii]
MKILNTNRELKSNLKRMISCYKYISFGVAWATSKTDLYELLLSHKNKIKIGVIGTHFYQTHPDVLDDFCMSKKVKFILQPNGVFHPKIYLFWNDEYDWSVVIGSANFTYGAMEKNTELCVLIQQDDSNYELEYFVGLISNYEKNAQSITVNEAKRYRNIWNVRSRSLMKIAEVYNKSKNTNILHSKVLTMDWNELYKEIQNDPYHGFKDRINLLKKINYYFEGNVHFSNMDVGVRCGIAGLRSEEIKNWAWFGSMIGAGKYYNAINSNNINISNALDEISLSGTITRDSYLEYVELFKRAFPEGRDGVGIATRLLSMKRPDQFICYNEQNKKGLAEEFCLSKRNLNYEEYWDLIIERIMVTPWWNSEWPSSGIERSAWQGRVAMLDVLFYKEK